MAASGVHPFCNLQSRARPHAVLVIGLYELLGNPATYPIEPPGSLGKMHVVYANINHSFEIADAAVSQSNRRYYNKPVIHHYGKSIVVQKDKIARSCPALHTLSVTIVTTAVTTLPLFQPNIQLGLLLYMEGT